MTADLHRRWLTHCQHREAKGISDGQAALYAEVAAALSVSEPDMSKNPEKTNMNAERVASLDTSAAPDALREALEAWWGLYNFDRQTDEVAWFGRLEAKHKQKEKAVALTRAALAEAES